MDFSLKVSGNTYVKSEGEHWKDDALNTGRTSLKAQPPMERAAAPMLNKLNSSNSFNASMKSAS